MALQSPMKHVSGTTIQAVSFERFAGVCAIITGVVDICYAISFVVLHNALLSALFLLLGGLFSFPVLIAVYQRVRETHMAFALLAFLFSVIGACGSFIHGGYDLANALHPTAISIAQANIPSAIDPRGLLVFGMAGLGIAFLAWLIQQGRAFPRSLSYVGYLAALLLVVLYLGRLIILEPTNLVIIVPALPFYM